MSNKNKIEEALYDLILTEEREFVAMLSGEWGIGKTYFWNEFKDKYLQNEKNVVYISLFGLNSLDDIKNEIIIQLSKYTKYLNKYRDKFKSIKGGNLKSNDMTLSIGGAVINASLSLFSTNDFKNIVICFDDFERLSDKVSLKDVMGLVSQFKEQKKCKIIMILNEKELNKLSDIDGKKHDEIFALYKEKIVDYNFNYQPSFDEIFEVVKNEIKYFNHSWIYDFFKKINLNNIRIMKQAIYNLNHFKFIQKYELNDIVIKEFVEVSLNIFIFKAKNNLSYLYFNKIKDYQNNRNNNFISKMINDAIKETPINDKYEKYLDYYVELNNSSQNKDLIERTIYNFLDNSIINKVEIKRYLEENNLSTSRYKIRDSIIKENKKFFLDFRTKNIDIAKKSKKLIIENKDDMHYLFDYNNFIPIIENIRYFSQNKIDIDKIEEEIIKNYIQENLFYEKDRDNPIEKIQKKYSWAKNYILNLHKKESKNTPFELNKIFNEIIQSSYLSPKNINILTNITSIIYIENIKSSVKFVELLIDILEAYSYELKKNNLLSPIKQAFEELQKEDVYIKKIEYILETTNIKLETKERKT